MSFPLSFSDNKLFNQILNTRAVHEQDRQSGVQENSWITNDHPFQADFVDFKLFAMIAGDAFISKNKDLEGGYGLQTLNFFLHFFNQLRGAEAEPEITELLQGAIEIETLMLGSYARFAKEMTPILANKDKIWFPSGWLDQNRSAHAVLLEIDFKSHSITLYNTGAGLSTYHQQTQLLNITTANQYDYDQIKSKDQQFIKIIKCDPSKLKSTEFYQFLYELRSRHKDEPNIELDYTHLVEGMKKFLGGKQEGDIHPEKKASLLRRSQRAGTCAARSILSGIYYTLFSKHQSSDKYKQLKFYWQTLLLVQVMKTGIKPKDKQLVQNIATNITRSIEKNDLKNRLKEEDLQAWEYTLFDIEERLSSLQAPQFNDNPGVISLKGKPDIKELSTRGKSSNGASPVTSVMGNMDARHRGLQAFKPQEAEILNIDPLGVVEALDKLKEMAATLREYPANTGNIYLLYAHIVKKAKEDPETQLKGYRLNLKSLKSHLEDPEVSYTNPQTHRSLQQAYEQLEGQETEKELFCLDNEARILITADTMSNDPTLFYFSQFLPDDPKANKLEALQHLLAHSESLPESVQCLYEAWYTANAIFLSHDAHPKFRPHPVIIQAHNPKKLAIEFSFTTTNKPVQPLFDSYGGYKTILDAQRLQNQIVAQPEPSSSVVFSDDPRTNKMMEMIGLDRIDLPNRLVAFFSRNLDLFSELRMCSYFLSQLFRPNLLINQIEAQPLFLEKLESFCRDAIEHFIQKEEYNTALSCLLMTRHIERFLSNFGPIDSRKKIVEDILPNVIGNNKKPTIKDLLRLLLDEFHDDPHSPEYEADLVAYVFSEGWDAIPHKLQQAYLEQIDSIRNNLQMKDYILHCLNLTGDDYSINFDERKVYRKDGSSLIDQHATVDHPFYKSYFKNQKVISVSLSSHTTLFRNEDESKELMMVKGSSTFSFVIHYQGEAYEYKSDAMDSYLETLLRHTGAMLGYASGTFWVGEKINGYSFFFNYYKVLQLDENGTPCLQFKYCFNGDSTITEITRLTDEAKLFYDSDATNKSDYSWINKDGDVVECHRDTLVYKRQFVDGLYRLYCDQYPGYYWVENDPTMGILESYTTIQNMAGEQLVLVKENIFTNRKLKPVIISLKCIDGKLSAGTVSGELYLIKHYIKLKRYEKAYEIVRSLNVLERFQDHHAQQRCEVTLFDNLLENGDEKGDPNELAIFLHLARIWLENRAKFPAKVGAHFEYPIFSDNDLQDVLARYLNLENNCTYSRLNVNQKLSLISLIKETYKINAFESVMSEWSGRIVVRRKFEEDRETDNINFSIVSPTYFSLRNRSHLYVTHELELLKRECSHHFVFSKQFFIDRLAPLYSIASNGTQEQKEWLKKVLDFNYAYYNHSYQYTLIYNKLRFPYLPSLALGYGIYLLARAQSIFKKCINILLGKWGNTQYSHGKPQKAIVQSQPLLIDGEAMRAADREFDTYLKTLRDAHFTRILHENTEQELPNLPVSHPSNTVALKLQQEQQDLEYFRANLLQPPHEIILTNIEELQKDLYGAIKDLSAQLRTMKAALLWQLNTGPTFKRIANQRVLKWEDLQKLSLSGDFALFVKTTQLDQVSAEKVLAAVGFYLVLESRLNQMMNINNDLVQVQHAADGSSKKRLMANKAYETMSLFPSEDRDYTQVDRLWFESANKYLYRKNQIEKLSELVKAQQQHPEIQAEMPTGYGKTKLVVPTLNQEMSKKGQAVINCWPATLEMTNIADMKVQIKKSFGKGLDRLAFDRASDFKAENLKAIHRSILDDMDNGRPINCCPEAVRALELHFLLTLDSQPLDKEKVTYFIKILKILRNSAWSSIDEEHVLLSPLDRLIYTLGQSFTLPDRDVAIVQRLFEVFTEEPFNGSIDLSSNTGHKLTDEEYKQVVEALALQFRKDLECDHYGDEFLAFVRGTKVEKPKWLDSHPKKEEISLVKGVLCFILQHALAGSVDENFGLSQKHLKTCEFAISFIGSNSPKETDDSPSQYRNPHETLVKTFITYLYKGLSKDQATKLILDLQEKIKREMLCGVSIATTEAFQIYKTFNVSTKKSLLTLEKDDIETVAQELCKNREAIFYYIKTLIVPQIKIYEESIGSDAQNFRSQFASSLSLSATPQDKATHGPSTHFVPMRGTSGQVTHLLLTKCGKEKSIHKMNHTSPQEAINEVVDKLQGRSDIKAVIDVGAQFKGLGNHEIALKLAQDPDVKGVVYMDEKDGTFKIFDKATHSIIDYTSAQVLPEDRHTYYDQNRCFGSDINQACDAVALLLTSEANTKPQIGQGIGRMRQLGKGQGLEVGVPVRMPEDNIKNLLVFWISNHVKSVAQLNYQSQLQQYDNALRRELLDKMFEYEEKPLWAAAIFKKNRDIFITKESFSPYLQYASTPKDASTTIVLEQKKQLVTGKIKKASGLSFARRSQLIEQLKKWDTEGLALPKTVSGSSNLGMECEVLQEVEVEVQLEVENQNQQQDAAVERRPIQWDAKLNVFKQGWEGSGAIFPTIKTIIRIFLNRYPGSWVDETIILSSSLFDTKPDLIISGVTSVLSGLVAIVSHVAFKQINAIQTTFKVSMWLQTFGATITFVGLSLAKIVALGSAIAFVGRTIIVAVSYVIKKATIYYAEKFHADNYVCRVNELMKMHLSGSKSKETQALSRCAAIFSKNFFATNNFYRAGSLELDSKETVKVISPQAPLNSDQKPIFEIMLIEDKGWFGRKSLKAIAIDKNDSVFFREKLQQDRKVEAATAAKRNRKVAIYDPVNDLIVAQGKNTMSLDELKKTREFHELTASAKFLNGEINFTDEELDYIERKVKDIGKSEVRNFFMEHILARFQPRHLNLLKMQKHSRLYKILAGK